MLDIAQKYGYVDKNETQWRFSFERLGDAEGWFAWTTRPGQHEICIGRIDEKDLVQKLKETPLPLNQDDFIDLELWMLHGGLELKPKERKIRKKNKKEKES